MHFHKAGGTTINALFDKYCKWEPNKNGNPWLNNNIIPFWNYKKDKFNIFKNILHKKGIEFVAFEWNYFKFFNEIDYKNIELITCIREPYKRFISNMIVDKHINSYNYNNKNIKWPWSESNQTFFVNYNKYNYYTKMLNGFGDIPNIELNDTHIEIAKQNLSKFSTIIILDDSETFNLLKKYDKIHTLDQHKNKNMHKNMHENSCVIDFEEFKRLNHYDYELYEYAKELSYLQLNVL